MVDPENAANGQPDPSIDASMAAAFVDYLDYREVLTILQRYGKGYQVTLIKGHGPARKMPSYRVLIYKLTPDAGGQDVDKEYFEWRVDGHAATLKSALKLADREAQRHLILQNPPAQP